MSSERHGIGLAMPPAVGWPPDDTEESVVGTNLHQDTIRNLCSGLTQVATGQAPEGQAAPWRVLSQTAIGGLRRWDGTPYTVLPDAFVYPHPIDGLRATLALAEEGPPALVVEVLSRTTYEADLDLDHGKGYSYARAGVREYLLLDPTGEYPPEQAQGRRLAGRAYVPRRPDGTGRWRSRGLGAAVGFEGARVAVYSGDGRRQLREGEVAREIVRKDEQITALEERLAQRDDELARRDADIAALRRLLQEREGDSKS